jgi:hypothetical protein
LSSVRPLDRLFLMEEQNPVRQLGVAAQVATAPIKPERSRMYGITASVSRPEAGV